MAHDHDHHHHGEANTYFLEQLFTIGTCGALGFATIMWYVKAVAVDSTVGGQGLYLFISPKYHLLVLFGGIFLEALVVVRAVALWFSVDRAIDATEHHHEHNHSHDHDHHEHAHDHVHGPDCDHHHETAAVASTGLPMVAAPHSHGGHGHDHGDHDASDHAHGWAPWRYVVLMLPIVLYFLNLPNRAPESTNDLSKNVSGITDTKDKGFDENVSFKQLETAAQVPELRSAYTGKTVRLVGKFVGDDDKRFTLTRFKMNCCAADAIPLNAIIMVDPAAKDKLKPRELRNKWVEVLGRVQFLTRTLPNAPDKVEYLPTVIVYPTEKKPLSDLVSAVSPPRNPFVD